MKFVRFAIIGTVFLLCGCLKQTQDDLALCKATADATYKNVSQMPLGQPYKDVYACMWTHGYEIDTSSSSPCRSSDSIENSENALCYRPRNFIAGYFFDMGNLIR